MKVWIAVGVIALLLIVGFSSYIGAKNQMVTKNETVKAAWSQVDIVLQRRADLIPNLVETVKGFATQEQTVFGDIAKARSQAAAATSVAANSGMVLPNASASSAYLTPSSGLISPYATLADSRRGIPSLGNSADSSPMARSTQSLASG